MLRLYKGFRQRIINSGLTEERQRAEGTYAEGKKGIFDTKVSPLWSAIRSKAPEFIYGEK
jgi:hypothetical protein